MWPARRVRLVLLDYWVRCHLGRRLRARHQRQWRARIVAVDGVSRNLLVGWAAGFHRDPAEHTGRRRLGNQCASLTFCLPATHGDPMTPPTRALFVLTLFLTACGGGPRP